MSETNHFSFEAGSLASGTVATAFANYYPLSMNYNQNGRKWNLSFKLRPEKRIELEGDTPTREELTHVISQTLLPALMIDVMEAIVGSIRE